jgi:chromosome segregation ATPase
MSDSDFVQSPADPLPDRLKQYLSETARREIDALRAALDSRLLALEAALAHPEPHDSLETLVIDLARVATAEAEASAARASLAAQIDAQERTKDNTEARRLLEMERAAANAARAELDDTRQTLEHQLAQERAAGKKNVDRLKGLEREVAEARQALDARSGALEEARVAASSAQNQAGARLTTLETEKGRLERAVAELQARVGDAEARARKAQGIAEQQEVARRDADVRVSEANARVKELDGRRQQVEAHAQEIESRRLEAEARAREAEARAVAAESRVAEALRARDAVAAEAQRARDASAAEADALRQAVTRDREAALARHAADAAKIQEHEQRFAASVEKVRSLELELFHRDRPFQDRDEDLSAMLERDLAAKPRRRASRYNFSGKVGIDFGGESGALVDLSIAGAQVVSAKPLEQGREAQLTLMSDEIPLKARAKVIWSRLDPNSQGQPMRYRAGLLFTAVDAASVEAFIIRYSTS